MPERLFLIDGSALYYRSYFAFSRNPLINSKGENTSATYGFLATMVKLIETEHPDYLAVVFDTKEPTFRHKIYEDYKATREKMPDEMAAQYPRLVETLKALNFVLLEKDGYEADDLIGTLAKKFAGDNLQVVIMSGDKDMAQLVNRNVLLYHPGKGNDQPQLLDEQAVVEKNGVKPEQIADWLALMGDSSDNIPGVPKVGKKTATDLLKQFGSLENLYRDIDRLKEGAVKNNLIQYQDQAWLSQDLATIRTDVPIDVGLEDLRFRIWDPDTADRICKELEFRRLANRMRALAQQYGSAEAFAKHDEKKTDYKLIESDQQLQQLAQRLSEQSAFVFDLETSSLDFTEAQIAGIAFSWQEKEAYYLPLQHPDIRLDQSRAFELLKPVFANPKIGKIAQNIKFDAMILEQHGVPVDGLYFDTMIAAYLLNPTGQFKLDKLSEEYLNYEMIHIEELIGKGRKQLKMTDIPANLVTKYAAEDADITYRLYQILKPKIGEVGMEDLLYQLEMPLVRVLMAMERQGVALDVPLLNRLSQELGEQLKKLEDEIFEMAGETFNLNSPQQMGPILFEKLEIHKDLGLKRAPKTKTGQYSTAESVLERYNEHPIVAKIMEYRKLSKLKNTYIDALPQLISPRTGRVHTSYNQTVTATGRLSSSNPNLQNIPIRTELGREIRKAFIPSQEDYVILSADYSQIELRIMAHLSEDPALIESFRKDEDIHTATAMRIFDLPADQITPDHRRKAKTINFGIMYGMGKYGLAQRLDITPDEAQEFISDYLATFQGVHRFMVAIIEQAREQGYVETMLHRRRYLNEIRSSNRQIREFAERTAINTPIQGSAADLIKKAMIEMHEVIEREKWPARMLLQVHDELVFEVHRKKAEAFADKVKSVMENSLKLKVPVKVDCGIGANWLEAHQ